MIIRREQSGDKAAIYRVHQSAFPTEAEARLVDRLRTDGMALISYVALVEEQIVGNVLFSPVTLTPAPTKPLSGLGLAPIAVLPNHQRKGIGSQLIEAGLSECSRLDVPYVVVLGEPEFYHRFGFKKASDRGLDNEYGVDDPFMVVELIPGSLDGVRGLVRYSPAFVDLA